MNLIIKGTEYYEVFSNASYIVWKNDNGTFELKVKNQEEEEDNDIIYEVLNYEAIQVDSNTVVYNTTVNIKIKNGRNEMYKKFLKGEL